MSAALDRFFEHYYRRRPVNATFTGVHDFDDQLPDWSLDGLSALDDEMHALGVELSAAHPSVTSSVEYVANPDALDAELARGFLEIQRAENASRHGPRGNPALWTGEAIFSVISLMIRDFAPIGDRIAAATARLDRIADFLGGPNGSLDAPVSPAWIDKARRECEGAVVLLTDGIERWTASANLPAPETRRVREAASAARTAFRMFDARLDQHPSAPDDAIACGPELFDLLLARGHQCTRSRSDLLAEARQRLEAERARLDALASTVAGSWASVQEQLAANHPTPDAYLPAFHDTWAACHARAIEVDVVTWPDWPVRYVPFPAWTADAAPSLYYLYYRAPAPFDARVTYEYVVPPLPAAADSAERHLRVWNHSTIKLNHVVHHGAIGHHVQNWHAYDQTRSRIGKVAAVDCASRIGMFCGGTMAEGWACYATGLMEELEFLTPLERVAEQHSRVRFLARAIVDIELHQRTMSFAECVRFYTEQVGMGAEVARSEAVKNSMFPCTALMYWLGTQTIVDLRDEMRRRDAGEFSLKRFHDELLSFGSVPVPLVARILANASLYRDERDSSTRYARSE